MNQFFDRIREFPFWNQAISAMIGIIALISAALGIYFGGGGGSSTPAPQPPVVTTTPSETTIPTTTTDMPPTETTTPNPPSEPSQPPTEPEEVTPIDIELKHFCPTDTHWITVFIPGKVDQGVSHSEEPYWTSKIYLDGKNQLEWKLGRRWDYGQELSLNSASIMDKGYTSMHIVGTWIDKNDNFKKYSFDETFDITNTCREPREW